MSVEILKKIEFVALKKIKDELSFPEIIALMKKIATQEHDNDTDWKEFCSEFIDL